MRAPPHATKREAAKRMRTVNSFIGSPIERFEDLRFLRGRGEYVDDLTRDGMLHAAILRSSVAHGRIRAIDTARGAGDCRACMPSSRRRTSANAIPNVPMRLQPLPEFEPFAQPVIAHDKVRYVGEAARGGARGERGDRRGCAGGDRRRHRAAAGGGRPACLGAGRRRCCSRTNGTNLAIKFRAVRGDAAAAFKDAPYTSGASASACSGTWRCRWRRAACSRNGMPRAGGSPSTAPPRCCSSTAARSRKQMGLAEDAIDMVENDVGGGFGARGEFYPEDFLIPFAARHVGRPVKWIEDRREQLMSATTRARRNATSRSPASATAPSWAARPCLFGRRRLYAHQRRGRRRATSRSSCRAPIASRTSTSTSRCS